MGSDGIAVSSGIDASIRRQRLHALYDAHVADVYRYVHRRCRDRQLAEDVTQDVFTRIAATVDDPASLGLAWLYRTARNRMVDVIRRQDSYERKLRLLDQDAELADIGDRTAEQVSLAAAMSTLRPLHRVVLTLHDLDGMSAAEIGEVLERSAKGAEALITRARAALRLALEDLDG